MVGMPTNGMKLPRVALRLMYRVYMFVHRDWLAFRDSDIVGIDYDFPLFNV